MDLANPKPMNFSYLPRQNLPRQFWAKKPMKPTTNDTSDVIIEEVISNPEPVINMAQEEVEDSELFRPQTPENYIESRETDPVIIQENSEFNITPFTSETENAPIPSTSYVTTVPSLDDDNYDQDDVQEG